MCPYSPDLIPDIEVISTFLEKNEKVVDICVAKHKIINQCTKYSAKI